MSQDIELNWGLKLRDPSKYKVGCDYCVVKGGYRVFPMSAPIDLIDWDKKTVGKVVVKKLVIKFQDFFTEEEARECGFKTLAELRSFLELEYPDAWQVGTFVHFERVS